MLEAQAHREISNRTQRVELEAQQWASNTTAQHRADLEQLRAQARAEIAEVQRNRDDEIQRLERSFAQQLGITVKCRCSPCSHPKDRFRT